jgi:hypothetical protein
MKNDVEQARSDERADGMSGLTAPLKPVSTLAFTRTAATADAR